MTGFARFTAIIFMLLGLAVIIGGGAIAVMGFTGSFTPAPSAPFLTPNYSGLLAYAGAFAGAAVAFQGLVLAAIGQVLWLMASMTDKAQVSNEYLDELVRRMGTALRK